MAAAGAADLIDRARPFFDAIGRATFIAGSEPWQANALKVCGNFMIASMLETFGEAYATLRKSGVDPHTFLEIMNALFASPVYAGYGAPSRTEISAGGIRAEAGLKDVRLVLAAAEECASPMPIASLIRDQFISAIGAGPGRMGLVRNRHCLRAQCGAGDYLNM